MSKDDASDLTIYSESGALPPELPSFAPVLVEAARAKLRCALVTCPSGEAGQRAAGKRRHDIVAALRTLAFTVEALQTGYTFQDDKAAAKVEAIAKAVQIMEREAALLTKILLSLGPK